MRNFYLFLLFLNSFNAFSQLGFCEGSKGDPIFHETFGTGTGSAPLRPGTTTFFYVTGDPNDGEYTVSSRVGQDNNTWHSYFPATTLSGGRALIVNASFSSGQFYRTPITGLCENTTYEFSAFLMNVYNRSSGACEDGGIPINVRFEIWDETDTRKLKEGSTGNITSTSTPQWTQQALTFQTEPGQEAIILKMFNNGDGGCGNDLAIDDIIFRSCGDFTEVIAPGSSANSYSVCKEDAPVSLTLTATPDFSVYTRHNYQWQESEDNVTWRNIEGETARNFTTPPLSISSYYRVKVAEDEINLDNNFCSSASDAFYVEILQTPAAPVNLGDIVVCDDGPIPPLQVTIAGDETVNWFDAPQQGNLLQEGGTSFSPPAAGVYYAEAIKRESSCEPGPRTAVSLTIYNTPVVEDEVLEICEDGSLWLEAGIPNMEYLWSTGDTGPSIEITTPGNYSVSITTVNGCSAAKSFKVDPINIAEIEEIKSIEQVVEIQTTQPGNFEYSLDGQNFQLSNRFENIRGGVYTAFVRDLQGCRMVSQEFPHIVIPRFITPNNDGYNDYLELRGVEYFNISTIRIYDRYGKLLQAGNARGFRWYASLNGQPLPADDYWYEIAIDGYAAIKGHITVKR